MEEQGDLSCCVWILPFKLPVSLTVTHARTYASPSLWLGDSLAFYILVLHSHTQCKHTWLAFRYEKTSVAHAAHLVAAARQRFASARCLAALLPANNGRCVGGDGGDRSARVGGIK